MTLKEEALEWYNGFDTDEWIEIEKKYGYYGHDIGTNEDDILNIYKMVKQEEIEENSKPLTREEKINYFRIALGLQHISITHEIADRAITTYEKILELKGDCSLKDISKIEAEMLEKYPKENNNQTPKPNE